MQQISNLSALSRGDMGLSPPTIEPPAWRHFLFEAHKWGFPGQAPVPGQAPAPKKKPVQWILTRKEVVKSLGADYEEFIEVTSPLLASPSHFLSYHAISHLISSPSWQRGLSLMCQQGACNRRGGRVCWPLASRQTRCPTWVVKPSIFSFVRGHTCTSPPSMFTLGMTGAREAEAHRGEQARGLHQLARPCQDQGCAPLQRSRVKRG